jgi:DNA-binding transcriptional MocR family regulator
MIKFCDALEKHAPKECKFSRPDGGYFVWMETPVDGGEFLKWCSKNGGPGAVPAIRFSPNSTSSSYSKNAEETKNVDDTKSLYSPAIRLSIGFHNVETLITAAEDLGKKLTEFIAMNAK